MSISQNSGRPSKFLRLPSVALFAGLAGAALFAVMALCARLCRPEMSFGQIIFARALGAILVLGFMHRKELRGIIGRESRVLWTRALYGSFSVWCYFLNIQESSIGIATTLNNLAPVFVMVFAVFFQRKKMRPAGAFGVALATAGVGLIAAPNGSELSARVLVIGLLSALGAALAYLSLKRAAGRYPSGVVVLCFSIVLLAFSVLDPSFQDFAPSRIRWWPLLGMVVSALLAQVFLTVSFRSQAAITAATLNLTVVVWAWLLDVAVLGTNSTIMSFVGVGAVLGGISLCNSGEIK